MNYLNPGTFSKSGPFGEDHISRFLAWTKCLHGPFGEDQMSTNWKKHSTELNRNKTNEFLFKKKSHHYIMYNL